MTTNGFDPSLSATGNLTEEIRLLKDHAETINLRLKGLIRQLDVRSEDELQNLVAPLDELVEVLNRNHSGASILADGITTLLPKVII